jgi:Domain of Unknown Function (DUF1080)
MRKKIFFIVCCSCAALLSYAQDGIPEGFTPLFNEKDLRGWHISRTTHQGTTPNFYAEKGTIVLQQHPYGQGGILLSNKKYKNFELYLEAKIDSFCNGGIFLRSTESGQAYQIELAEPGGTGDLLGEMLRVSKGAQAVDKAKVWKANDWNTFRIRMEGEIPHIILWINGVKMWEVTEPVNDFIAGATEGMIGLQAHWSAPYAPHVAEFDMSGSWRPGGMHRFRHIAIKELK